MEDKPIETLIRDLESRREWADAFEYFEPGFQIGYLQALDWAVEKAKQCANESK